MHLKLLYFSLRFVCCSLQKTILGPVVMATLKVQVNLRHWYIFFKNPPSSVRNEIKDEESDYFGGIFGEILKDFSHFPKF